jgi:two-component system cell cycle sensor histidine kinase PleC
LKSKLRIGTEVIVTFPPERVMSALAPVTERAPPLQPEYTVAEATGESRPWRSKPILSAGTGL